MDLFIILVLTLKMFENTVEKEAHQAFCCVYWNICKPQGQTDKDLIRYLKLWFPKNPSAKACIRFFENIRTNKKMNPEGWLGIPYVNEVLRLFYMKGKLVPPPPEDWQTILLG